MSDDESLDAQTSALIDGETYFIVTFPDDKLLIPVIQTLRFIGLRNREDGTQYAYFHNYESLGDEAPFIVELGDIDALVLDRAQLIDILGRCFAGTLASP